MNTLKISVIIPVYNVEKYLEQCLDSVLTQSLNDIEVICVDDGSTDDSLKILREYARKDQRLICLTQKNKGPSSARNRALKIAHGEYIAFMDPDDYYPDKDTLGFLYGLTQKGSYLIVGGLIKIFSKEKEQYYNDMWMKKNAYPHLEELAFSEYQSPYGYTRYLFSRQLLNKNNIRFPALRRFQDPPFCAKALHFAQKLYVSDRIVYCYRKEHKDIDWGSDMGVRALHYLDGIDLLLCISEVGCYKKMARQAIENLRCGLPENILMIEPVKKRFANLLASINRLSVLDDSEKKKLLKENGHNVKLAETMCSKIVKAFKDRGAFFVLCRGAEYILGLLRLLPKERELKEQISKMIQERDDFQRKIVFMREQEAKLRRDLILTQSRLRVHNWAIDNMFETVRESALSRPFQNITLNIGAMRGTGFYKEKYPVVAKIINQVRISSNESSIGGTLDYAFLWGNGHNAGNACVLGAALKYAAVLVLCEDGFIRSADTWANFKAQDKFRFGCSLICDTRACYYDATTVSTVEMMINDKALVITEFQKAEARRLIDRIVVNKITKYNHQPIYTPEVGRKGHRKVLVVDQSYGDFAIRKGWADDSTFENMLKVAIEENPDADILVKTHPDTMTGTRKGYYDDLEEHDNIFRVTMPVNPYSLMDIVEKVYVCSTQFGFEALMAGKEVHVFGMPFYAGWGLTIDAQKNSRRTNVRSLEEVFYIFYVLYTHWMNPVTGNVCSLDECIDCMIKLREEYQNVLSKDSSK